VEVTGTLSTWEVEADGTADEPGADCLGVSEDDSTVDDEVADETPGLLLTDELCTGVAIEEDGAEDAGPKG